MITEQPGAAPVGRQPAPRTYSTTAATKYTQANPETHLIAELEREQRILYDSYGQLLTITVDLLADLPKDWRGYLFEKDYVYRLSMPVMKDLKAALREVA